MQNFGASEVKLLFNSLTVHTIDVASYVIYHTTIYFLSISTLVCLTVFATEQV